MDRVWISSDCSNVTSLNVEIRYSYQLLQLHFRKKTQIHLYSVFVAKRYSCLLVII